MSLTCLHRLLLASTYCVCTAAYCRSLVQGLQVGWPRLLAVTPLVVVNFAMPFLFDPVAEGPAILITVLVLMFLHTFKVRLCRLQGAGVCCRTCIVIFCAQGLQVQNPAGVMSCQGKQSTASRGAVAPLPDSLLAHMRASPGHRTWLKSGFLNRDGPRRASWCRW